MQKLTNEKGESPRKGCGGRAKEKRGERGGDHLDGLYPEAPLFPILDPQVAGLPGSDD